MIPGAGVYLHFPWCIRKCPYCDFNSHPLRDRTSTDLEDYVTSLKADWESQCSSLGEAPRFETVFLGGGTPSLFSPGQIGRVLQFLPLAAGAEVTLEANPGAAEHGRLGEYADAGVTRLSLGAQTFNPTHLQALGRIHTSADIPGAFAGARKGGFRNINLDLMWGLPGQTVEDAIADLEAAIDLEPEHVSWYQLTIEPRTEFAQRPPILPVEDTLAEIEIAGLDLLNEAGYKRYEVSAYAKPGYECRHNLNYWQFGDYLGLGAGAHGKVTREGLPTRTRHPASPRLYQQDPTALESDSIKREVLSLEFMMNALRLVGGVERSLYEERTGMTWESIEPLWRALEDEGLVVADRCATTPQGLRYLDSILGRFL